MDAQATNGLIIAAVSGFLLIGCFVTVAVVLVVRRWHKGGLMDAPVIFDLKDKPDDH